MPDNGHINTYINIYNQTQPINNNKTTARATIKESRTKNNYLCDPHPLLYKYDFESKGILPLPLRAIGLHVARFGVNKKLFNSKPEGYYITS